MKTKFFHFLGFSVLFFFALSTNAQENSPGNESDELLNAHPELNLREDKSLIYEPSESRNLSGGKEQALPAAKVTAPAKGKPAEAGKAPAKAEDDALSFNFLYYIIQKFKISDIVEQ